MERTEAMTDHNSTLRRCGNCNSFIAAPPTGHPTVTACGECVYTVQVLPACFEATRVRMLPTEGTGCLCWSPVRLRLPRSY